MQSRFLIFVLLFLLILPTSFAAVQFTVGVSPPVIELGDVERGSTKIIKFYIVTPSEEPLLVYLEPEPGTLDFFTREKYKHLFPNCSEEDVTSFVEFLRNPVELAIQNETLKTVAGEIRGWREVSFLLNIPKDVEPGYHHVKIKPVPYTPPEVIGQAGARVVAITSVSLLFNVPGDARRDGVILDVTAGSFVGGRLEINTYFQNTGTVTISAKAEQNVSDNGNTIATLTSATQMVKPGEVKIFKAYLPTGKVSFGKEYNVSTTVSFTTGSVLKSSTIMIQPAVIVPILPAVFPWWVVILIVIIVLIAIGIYKWYR